MLGGSTAALLIGSVAVGVIIGAFVLPAFFAEQFPIRVRATGLGLAYGVGSAVIGGTAPLLATVLSRQLAPVRGARLPGAAGRRGADRGDPAPGDPPGACAGRRTGLGSGELTPGVAAGPLRSVSPWTGDATRLG